MSTVDGAIDCQPIVYERCYTGEALDADGICVSERWEECTGKWEWYLRWKLEALVWTCTTSPDTLARQIMPCRETCCHTV